MGRSAWVVGRPPPAANQHTPGEFTTQYGLRTADNEPHPPDQLPLVRAKRGEVVENALLYAVTPEAPDGLWLSTSARPLAGGGAIVVFRDITERRKLEMDLAARSEWRHGAT